MTDDTANETIEQPAAAATEEVISEGRYKGMTISQIMSLRMLEITARRLRAQHGATIWISVAMPLGAPVDGGQTMNLIGYAVGCDCEICGQTNTDIVQGIQNTIETLALKDMDRVREAQGEGNGH